MRTMSSNHAVCSLGYPIIGCPRYRYAALEGAIAIELKRILAETCSVYGWEPQAIEIRPDTEGAQVLG